MLKQSISVVSARRNLYQAKLFFWLFLVSLGVFFAASLICYVLVRTQVLSPVSLPYEPLQIPSTFWVSTGLLILVSVFLERAAWLVHRERQLEFRRWLMWAWSAALAFLLVQAIGLQDLLSQHWALADGALQAYGMSFALSLIHLLHVVGGIGFLGYIIVQAMRNRYDHERHWAVDHCAGYWHFLDVVWLAMLGVFAFVG